MQERPKKIVVWFEEVGKGDLALVGGKGANLGEMTQARVPVPPGFIVTADSYFYFLEKSNLRDQIAGLLKDLDPNDSARLQEAAEKIKETIRQAEMPSEVAEEIRRAYRKLGGLVAVRSSATAEDLPEASFAGQQSTFLNVQGEDEVLAAVQACWASLFESRAIFYRAQQNLDHLRVGIAVPVQKMVQSEVSGVLFTLEPVTSDQSKLVIEAVLGLGEAIVSGDVTPDLYVVDKAKLSILDKRTAKQEWQIVRNPGGAGRYQEANVKVPLAEADQGKEKLTDEEIFALAKIGKRLEELYQFPQDVEWAKERGQLLIVQTRPVTTIKEAEAAEAVPEVEAKVLVTGSAASPGMATGLAKVILNASEINKVLAGDVLVAEMTTPDFVPAMKRAAAIVTDRGGRTCHAAIVSRELGLPCVVGTGDATTVLEPGSIVTVDGSRGKVYEGRVIMEEAAAPVAASSVRIETATRVYVNLAEPELAEVIAARVVDGVGLLRAEFMIAQIGEHPKYMIKENRGQEFIDKLAGGLAKFGAAFHPRPVVYRTTDFKTNEYANLRGGQEYEQYEENPMLGYRGVSRYVEDIDVFKLEIEAIKKAREQYKNLWAMIPFVRTVQEMANAKRIMAQEGLVQSEDFKLWMMVEVPSNVFLIDQFLDVGIDGISIGSNDLTQLVLGIDRDNPKLAEKFDERNEAVMIALERVVKATSSRGVTSSICGQAPSVYPELTEKLVEWGITSVSVSPDMIDRTREIVAEVERRLGKLPPQ